MPYSSDAFDKEVESIIARIRPMRRFLDVGAGAGKYGRLVRRHAPVAKRIGIEIEPDYVTRFRLRGIYDEIWVMRAQDLIAPKYLSERYDLVIVGDAIEHLKKSEGIDLINFLVYRSAWILIQYPDRYLQNAVAGYPSEAHISFWGEDDFRGLDRTRIFPKGKLRLVVIKGYLKHRLRLDQMEEILAL